MGQRIDISRAKKHLSGMVTRGGRSLSNKKFSQILNSNQDIQSSPTLRKAAYKIARSKSKKSTVSGNTFKRLSKAMIKHGKKGFEGSGVKKVSLSKKGRKVAKAHKSFTNKVVNEQKEAENSSEPSKEELARQKKREQARKNLNLYRSRRDREKKEGRFVPGKENREPASQENIKNQENSSEQTSNMPLSSGGMPQSTKSSVENPEHFSSVPSGNNLQNQDKKSNKISSLEEKKDKISQNNKTSEESSEEPPDEGLFAA